MTDKGLKILLIEDSVSDAALLQENLSLSGARDISISVVQSLHEAESHLKNNHIDAILLDLTLPDSSGLGTVREAKLVCSDLPVIVLTGIDDETTGIEAVRMGVQDYIVKGDLDGRLIARALRYAIERQRMEMALRESEAKLRAIFETSVDAIGVSRAGIHFLTNPAYLTLFGYSSSDDLAGKPITDLIAPSERPAIVETIRRRARRENVPSSYETRGCRKDGTEFDMDVHVSTYKSGSETFAVVVIRDITERKRAEEALQNAHDELEQKVVERTAELAKSTERLRLTLDNMVEGCMIIGYDWTYLYVNDSAARQGHQKRENLIGRKMLEMYPGVEKSEVFAGYKHCMDDHFPRRFESTFTFPDGATNWFEFSVEPVREGIFVLTVDITERKHTEEALRALTKRVVEVQEEERQRIARELHDDVCQRLTATKLHLDALDNQIPKSNQSLQKKIRSVRKQLRDSINDVRRISSNLRPLALDDLGLVAALRVLCREFEKENSIKVRFVARSVGTIVGENNIEIALYRIMQEALANILKHAHAKEVCVTLMYHEDIFSLIIKDDGRGFDLTKQAKRKDHRGFGLMSMRERAQLIGGSIIMTSARGKGTVVHINIPYHTEPTHEKN